MKKVIGLAVVAALVVSVAPAQAVSLTMTQKNQLKYLVEEEKLARDVYSYLAQQVGSRKFSNIVRSEQSHMDQVSALMATYGVYNPTTNRAPGVFANKDLQALYTKLTTEGRASLLAAFNVGVTIETMDIKDLQDDLKGAYPADITSMMNILLQGSKNHLAAFTR